MNQYCEAYCRCYGTFTESMTEDEHNALYDMYLDELLADAYALIRRGGINTVKAEQVMAAFRSDRTDGGREYAAATERTNGPGEKYSADEMSTSYEGKNLAEDKERYSYVFLTKQKDMTVTTLPEVPLVRSADGKISQDHIAELGIENAKKVGIVQDGKVLVENEYTNRHLQVTNSAIRHGLGGKANRVLTNARLCAVAGELTKNAIPINALHNTAKNATGTYAMAAYANDSKGRAFVAVITVEEYSDTVSKIETYDVVHAISGREKNSSRADTKSQGVTPSTAAKVSIADFLQIVNTTHQSVLSNNVLATLGEKRSDDGYYSDRVEFSVEDDTVYTALAEKYRDGTASEEETAELQRAVEQAADKIMQRGYLDAEDR